MSSGARSRPRQAEEASATGTRFPMTHPGGGVPWWSRVFGIRPGTSYVEVSSRRFHARFGPWSVTTTIDNIEHLEPAGPYAWVKVAGPARYSLHDHSLTFATTTDRAVDITFVEPVTGLDPLGILRHPSLTVTVDDPEGLVAAIVEAAR